MHRVVPLLALAVLLGAGCGRAADDVDPGQPEPGPTVTVTATETATPAPTPTSTGEPAPTAAPDSAVCTTLEGGEGLAFIFVSQPRAGATVESGFQVTGCSNTFEAAYQWELLAADGTILASDFGTATCGTGCVGEFAFTVAYEGVEQRQVGTLRVFTTSPRDGSETDVNSIPVILHP